MTVANALFTEQEVIKETNSALEDIQETLALSLVDSLKAGDHITTPTVINMLKDLEDMQLKYYDARILKIRTALFLGHNPR
ncbi:MAG: hypothetical protein WA079_09170 [Leuconostoc falkenbergense]|uniref:hypothetical protein n=1 Tax=Leuconostoc falkenbergense TaxID=2766470 RepID=UPI003BB7386F